MPGFYPPGEYDLAGFIVGAVERKKLITGKNVKPGDALIALPSAGLHTNGYSLARKLVFEVAKLKPETYVAEVGNKIGAELLKPHLCYAPALKNIVARGWVSALAHITGGGIPGNLPRVLPTGVKANIDLASWPIPAIFKYLAKLGKIDTDELLQSFNMGVGMILVAPPKNVQFVEATSRSAAKNSSASAASSAANPAKPGSPFRALCKWHRFPAPSSADKYHRVLAPRIPRLTPGILTAES